MGRGERKHISFEQEDDRGYQASGRSIQDSLKQDRSQFQQLLERLNKILPK